MEDFIVLGLIPGTQVQLDLRLWLYMSACIVIVLGLLYALVDWRPLERFCAAQYEKWRVYWANYQFQLPA